MKPAHLSILVIGDAFTLAVVTVIGFATHGEIGSAGLRMLTTFIPLLLSWALLAPHFGVYHSSHIRDVRQLWRPFWSMLMAAPLAGLLRGLWLGRAISPLFVVILGGSAAIAMLAWRFLYWLISQRVKPAYG